MKKILKHPVTWIMCVIALLIGIAVWIFKSKR